MNEQSRRSGRGRGLLSRREFLIAGAVGAGALAFGGSAALGQEAAPRGRGAERSVEHRGSEVRVGRANGRDELYVDGEHIRTIDSNGVYRADGFMFSPETDLVELGKRVVDARRAYAARGAKAGAGVV